VAENSVIETDARDGAISKTTYPQTQTVVDKYIVSSEFPAVEIFKNRADSEIRTPFASVEG